MQRAVLDLDRQLVIGKTGHGNRNAPAVIGGFFDIIPSGAKADSGGDSQRAESLNLWRQVLGGHGHGYSDRIAGGF
jgi:hypothetical protein